MRNFVITVNGKSYNVGVEEVGASESAPVEIKKVEKVETAKAVSGNGQKLLSPFPGLVKNLLVEDGATVKKDQPIMVLEAMKMDNDITSPCDGKVSFKVSKGANVESNAVLAIIG